MQQNNARSESPFPGIQPNDPDSESNDSSSHDRHGAEPQMILLQNFHLMDVCEVALLWNK